MGDRRSTTDWEADGFEPEADLPPGLPAEMEAGSEGQAGTEVPVLRPV